MKRFAIQSFLALSVCSCAYNRAPEEKPILTINNYGGYSHGGLMYVFQSNNTYTAISYSDVVSKNGRLDQSHINGKYFISEDEKHIQLLNSEAKAHRRLFKYPFKGNTYWLSGSEMKTPEKIIRNSGSSLLREKP